MLVQPVVASAFTHALAAAALGSCLLPAHRGLIAFGALCAAAPDLDVIGFRLGVAYADLLGHRGLSHSLAFALLAAAALSPLWSDASRTPAPRAPFSRARVVAFLFLAIASHGLLDACTNGGLGVAFFAPFSAERYFFPWRPIEVSPISVGRFFSARGLAVLRSEALVVWAPALLFAGLGALVRRAQRRSSSRLG